MISVFSTRTVEVGGREWSCVKGCPKDGFAFTVCTLMDYSIIDVEVADVFGDAWPMIRTYKREGVVAGVPRIVTHPVSSWVVSIPFFSLGGGMHHPC